VISLPEARTDADFEAWIEVRRAVLPNESGGTVELLRAQDRPERLLLLAELDGRLAGTGLADRSDVGDRFAVKPRVLPWARRRGVGAALLHALAGHVERFGVEAVASDLEEPEARGFAERPDLLRAAYPLACEGYADFALDGVASISLESWLREEATLPAGSFVALEGGQVVGYSGLLRHDNEGVAEDGLTVVRRDRRRRGLALALRRMELVWAAAGAYREVVTWTQQGNHAMRRLNELLGYEYRDVSVTMLAPQPLP
jgi:mycothiol synthase